MLNSENLMKIGVKQKNIYFYTQSPVGHENTQYANLSGEAVNILFFDNGKVNSGHFKNRTVHLSNTNSNAESDHASRVSIICSGDSLISSEGWTNIGLAPNANLFFVEYLDVFPDKYLDTVKNINKEHGRIHISAHAYSGKNTYYISKEAQHQFNLLNSQEDISHLVIAAAGHDGQDNIRFPASISSVLAVGVHDDNLYPTKYCGSSLVNKKPELMVSDYNYITRLPNGDLSQINGTSAAVGIVTGLAALWCEKLKQIGENPHPTLLKAILIATGEPSSVAYSRIAKFSTDAIIKDFIYHKKIMLNECTPIIFDINLTTEAHISIAFIPCNPNNKIIDSFSPEIELHICLDGQLPIIEKSHGYLVCDIDTTDNKKLLLHFATFDNCYEGFIVISGINSKSSIKQITKSSGHKKRPLTIVGVSASHDASACVMQNGEIKAAIQLERITRIKRDGQGYLNSEKAIRYCLETLGLSLKDVDYFAFNSQPLMPEYYGLSQPTHDKEFQLFDPFDKNCLFVSHHLAHAFSSFFSSSFREAAVYVADGSGGSTVGDKDLILFGDELHKYLNQELQSPPPLHVESSYLFTNGKYELIDRRHAKSFNIRCGSGSLGEVYAAVSQLIFGNWQDGGKLMGLAPYGNPEDYGPSLLEYDRDGILKFTHAWKNNHRDIVNKLDPMEHKNLAARIQLDLETALLQRFQLLKKRLNFTENAAYAGGLALNCVANEKLILHSGFKDIYIHPASNDAGISIGAAAAAHYQLTGKTIGSPMKHAFLGHPYKEHDYEKAISLFKDFIKIKKISPVEIAMGLAEGKIYGIFEGSCEFGPRALGHRSIIADSRNVYTWKFINKWIKFREDFRPFAPAVPVDQADKFFETNNKSSPYMLRAVKVKEEYQNDLGAVTHLNGLARIQTVDKNILPRFHDILSEFGKITGIPVLVNTSLNVRGQPLVETPEQAIEMLLCTHLSGIIFENTLVTLAYDSQDELTDTSILTFSPDVCLKSEIIGFNKKTTLETKFRRKNIILEEWQYKLLSLLHDKPTLQIIKLLASELALNETTWLPWVKSLLRLRYIYQINY